MPVTERHERDRAVFFPARPQRTYPIRTACCVRPPGLHREFSRALRSIRRSRYLQPWQSRALATSWL